MIIVLVHGLGRTPFSMFGLASALRKAGHQTTFFGYTSSLESLTRIVQRLTAKLTRLGRDGTPLVVIGHSLGGLLLRKALAECPTLNVAHLLMLGTPNQPPRMARWAWHVPPFRYWTRDCGRLLATSDLYADLPSVSIPYTVVAGTAGPTGRLSPFGSEPNDGIVAVSETRVAETDTPVLVPAFHSFLMDDARVREIVVKHIPPARSKPTPKPWA